VVREVLVVLVAVVREVLLLVKQVLRVLLTPAVVAVALVGEIQSESVPKVEMVL
jgi:hypothetical protein